MKSILKSILIALACCTPLIAGAETECLSVTDNIWSKKGSEFGITYVEWQAELTNACEASYDADLEIRFVDADGGIIYQSRDLISVPRNGNATTRREFNIPDAQYEELADVLVIIKDERERPF